jgi:hypothetical protein
MKRMILLEILRQLQADPRRKSRMKWIFGGVSLLAFAMVGLFIWVSVVTVNMLVAGVKSVAPHSARIEMPKLDVVTATKMARRCWEEGQAQLDVAVWLSQPLGESLQNARRDLGVACGFGEGSGREASPSEHPSQLHEAKALDGRI